MAAASFPAFPTRRARPAIAHAPRDGRRLDSAALAAALHRTEFVGLAETSQNSSHELGAAGGVRTRLAKLRLPLGYHIELLGEAAERQSAQSRLLLLGLGAMLRSTAGALTAAYGLLFLIPQLAKALPSQWYADSVRWLPGGDVINAITSTERQLPQHVFSAWGEFAVFGGYTAIVLAAGALLLRRRDA